MKLLAWNIQHGGGTRLARIIEELSAYDADVIAVTEFRTNPGATLREALRARGWPHVETTNPAGNQNGIAVFSKMPMRRTRPYPSEAPSEDLARWLEVELPDYSFTLNVMHIRAAASGTKDPSFVAKTRFWDAVLTAAEARLHHPCLFVGDWNTGAHRMDESGKTFVCVGHFAKLSALGWTDMWRQLNTGPTEWTWYSKLKGGVRGNGFRLDHAFATPSLLPRIASCRYSHAEREAKISDHSMLILEMDEPRSGLTAPICGSAVTKVTARSAP